MTYKIISYSNGDSIIERENKDNSFSYFAMDESNPDYQQYLIDTDGGLPIPEEQA